MSRVALKTALAISALCLSLTIRISAAPANVLRVGVAEHAFDHLGSIGDQADAAAASGANIIYGSGFGVFGYQGLPVESGLEKERRHTLDYINKSKSEGIRLAIGYVCATSIVGLDTFDKNWTPKFRAQFHTPPSQWRQVDRKGNPLPSWYGGKYQPACMNNPDWRAYEKNIVRMQMESGFDGIFFDNPTVHPQGCHCQSCMEKFRNFLTANHKELNTPSDSIEGLRDFAANHPREFMEFRCTIARDFLAEMRSYARSIRRGAFVTCNNSLNSPEVLFSQCRRYAYNIDELSKAEDWVTVEDVVSQPRMLANGQTLEYGPTYKQLHAISHGKPIAAVTVAEADYHTAPHLVRLAMAEAAANGASYLSWPTWPENIRQKMAATIRPEADFLRANEKLLNDVQPRSEVLLLLSFRRWLDTETCKASECAALLVRSNIQFTVVSETGLKRALKRDSRILPVLVIEAFSKLDVQEREIVTDFANRGGRVVESDQPHWLGRLAIEYPSITLQAPPTVRAVVADQRHRTIVHLYNLAIERISSFEDKVHPTQDIRLSIRVPFNRISSVRALTADADSTCAPLQFTAQGDGKQNLVKCIVPRLEIAAILVIEGSK